MARGHSLGSRNDRDTSAAERTWHRFITSIAAKAWTAYTANTLNYAGALIGVLEIHFDYGTAFFAHQAKILDVAFFLQNSHNVRLQARSWNFQLFVLFFRSI